MNVYKRNPDDSNAPYYARFQVRGRPYLWSTKTNDLFLAKKRAKEYRALVVAKSFNLVDGMKARSTGPTFGDVVKEYLKHPAPSARTRRENVAALKRVLAASKLHLTDSLTHLGTGLALQWQSHATGQGVPPSTANTVLRCARSLFSRHAMLRYTPLAKPDSNAVRGLFAVPCLKEPERRPELPTREAVELAALNLPQHPEAYRAYLLARYAGLRAGEIKAARKEWLDGDILYVGGKEFVTKSRKWRPIALPPEVAAILRDSPTDSLVGPHPIQTVNRVLPALLHSYGFPQSKPLHSLRRLFGSIVYTQQGPRQARDALGHSTQAVTDKHYARSLDLPAPVAFAG